MNTLRKRRRKFKNLKIILRKYNLTLKQKMIKSLAFSITSPKNSINANVVGGNRFKNYQRIAKLFKKKNDYLIEVSQKTRKECQNLELKIHRYTE